MTAAASGWSRMQILTSRVKFQLRQFEMFFYVARFPFWSSQWWYWSMTPWRQRNYSWDPDQWYLSRHRLRWRQSEVRWRQYQTPARRCDWYERWTFRCSSWSQHFCFRGVDRLPWAAGSRRQADSGCFRPLSYYCEASRPPFCNLFKLKDDNLCQIHYLGH